MHASYACGRSEVPNHTRLTTVSLADACDNLSQQFDRLHTRLYCATAIMIQYSKGTQRPWPLSLPTDRAHSLLHLLSAG
jgi:hypothetical protein